MSGSEDIIYRYWGKADTSDENRPAYHLLPYHCLDVAAVASVWWDASPSIRRGFCQGVSLSETQVRAWVLFFVVLHDYGKFDARFQLRSKTVWYNLYSHAGSFDMLPSEQECKDYIHGEGGLFWFQRDCNEMLGIGRTKMVYIFWIPPTKQIPVVGSLGSHGSKQLQDITDISSGRNMLKTMFFFRPATNIWRQLIEKQEKRGFQPQSVSSFIQSDFPAIMIHRPSRLCWQDSVLCQTDSFFNKGMAGQTLCSPRVWG